MLKRPRQNYIKSAGQCHEEDGNHSCAEEGVDTLDEEPPLCFPCLLQVPGAESAALWEPCTDSLKHP